MTNLLNLDFVTRFIRMADDGWRQGWHERNGGNLSYRLSAAEAALVAEVSTNSPWVDIGTEVPALCGAYFLVTGSGRFFRNMDTQPESGLGLIRLDPKGRQYQIVWGLLDSRPTSELPTHLMNHEVKLLSGKTQHRVIYHAHPVNIIALSFVLPLDDQVFTRALWESATECPVIFPDGVGVVPWMVPGGRDIALATAKQMQCYDVVLWAHHGLFCSGIDFDDTFGLMHTVEKAAEILVKILSIRPDRLQTISSQNFRDLATAFSITLPERFLTD